MSVIEELCWDGGGYAWSYLYYNREKDEFYEECYHCGSVDICEDHYDGRKVLSKEYVKKTLVKLKREDLLEKYARELHIGDSK